jgi:hypothetical protein
MIQGAKWIGRPLRIDKSNTVGLVGGKVMSPLTEFG